ncbi:MAG: enoyl-CoA hydratase [Chloroflexi bacterium]|nr:MAG: enoyl-CoA hydratase [Chloroflexota bacterium]
MDFVQLTQHGPVVTVTLNRPQLHNAFSAEMIVELSTAFAELAHDPAVRVVVLTGAGPSFCAGADLGWMRDTLNLTHAENIADAERLAAMYEALNTLPQPVVGRINGAAVGGGVGLAACCDIVVAVEGAKFGFSEVKLGLVPAVIARYVVPKIGVSHARALFVSGRRFDAAHAQRIGLVHDVVPEAKLDGVVRLVIDDLLTSGPASIAQAKELVQAVATLPPAEVQGYTVAAIADARTSAEGQEGLRAFLEKRRPSWAATNRE